MNLGNITHGVLTKLLLESLPEIARLNQRKRFPIDVDAHRLSVIDLEG